MIRPIYHTILSIFAAGTIAIFNSCSQNDGFEGSDVFIEDFEARRTTHSQAECWADFKADQLARDQKEAMQFLYAYMTLPDMVDYSYDYYLENVNASLTAREEMPWGKLVPDKEFLHFVLPLRVNNENLDSCRTIFYKELKDRIKDMSMYDAVLEVNHWCHEKVTYQPSDVRTSSPLATIKTAHGRCGEESTFTVAALRSVGIPARQVYTPRWAHTDNNHAWVEVWVDGQWYFLGACEPEPVLNLGWFNAPASRGMLMYAKVFGNYNGGEEIIGRTACNTEINVTGNYAPTRRTFVKVVDDKGKVADATVEFKIYNYSELYSAATMQTDADGAASLITGFGDMVAWARKDGKYGFTKYTVGKQDTVLVMLDKSAGYLDSFAMDIVPPSERNTLPDVTAEQREINNERFVYEDSLRNAYIRTFISDDEIAKLEASLNMKKKTLHKILKESRGNHASIVEFISTCKEEDREKAVRLLKVIAEKDRRDITPDILHDHLINTRSDIPGDEFHDKYIMNPRVSNEMLTSYKGFFKNLFSETEIDKYRKCPSKWSEWCRDSIAIDTEWNPRRLCMSPMGVWKMRLTDAHSRDIFFVSAARTFGIPARIDEVTGKTQYYEDKRWKDADFDTEKASKDENGITPSGILKARYTPTKYIDNPRYASNFSISKIENGKLILQNHPDEATWADILKHGYEVDEGDYMIMTGTRMANGSVLSHVHFVEVKAGKTTTFQMIQRESEEDLQVIGDFNSENLFFDLETRQQRTLLSATGRGYYIIALIEPNGEPSNHFLRDIALYKNEFEQWGRKMVILFKDEATANRFRVEDFPELPSTIVWGTDINGKIEAEIKTNLKLENFNRPVILLTDTFNRVVFSSQGYTIGLGERLIQLKDRNL